MEVFKHKIKFTNWGQVYVGIKEGWLTVDKAVEYFLQGKIPYREDRDVRLYFALEKGHFDFLEEIKKFIVEDDGVPIVKSEETIIGSQVYGKEFPIQYYDIWEVELMLRVYNDKNDSKEAKLYQLDFIRVRSDFKAWLIFWYGRQYGPDGYAYDELYGVFESYLNTQIKKLQNISATKEDSVYTIQDIIDGIKQIESIVKPGWNADVIGVIAGNVLNLSPPNQYAVKQFVINEIEGNNYGYRTYAILISIGLGWREAYPAYYKYFENLLGSEPVHKWAKGKSVAYQNLLHDTAMRLLSVNYIGEKDLYKIYIEQVVKEENGLRAMNLLVQYARFNDEWACDKLAKLYERSYAHSFPNRDLLWFNALFDKKIGWDNLVRDQDMNCLFQLGKIPGAFSLFYIKLGHKSQAAKNELGKEIVRFISHSAKWGNSEVAIREIVDGLSVA